MFHLSLVMPGATGYYGMKIMDLVDNKTPIYGDHVVIID